MSECLLFALGPLGFLHTLASFGLRARSGLGRSPWETPFGRITRKIGLQALHKVAPPPRASFTVTTL